MLATTSLWTDSVLVVVAAAASLVMAIAFFGLQAWRRERRRQAERERGDGQIFPSEANPWQGFSTGHGFGAIRPAATTIGESHSPRRESPIAPCSPRRRVRPLAWRR